MKGNFLQFELWKDCRNGCHFCFNKSLQDMNKITSMDFVLSVLRDDSRVAEFDEVGFIGGEFFDNQLENEDVEKKFYEVMQVCVDKLVSGQLKKLYVTSSMIFQKQDHLTKFLTFLQQSGCLDKLLLCTSYDLCHRFNTPKQLEWWQSNMIEAKRHFPILRLHTEIIMTQAFIDAVMSGKFDIKKFKETYSTDIDYLEPNTGSFYDGKEEFNKHVPGFLPKRKDFIAFLKKTCIEDKSIELFKLFSKQIRSDTIYLILNGKHVEICGRRNGSRLMGLNLPILPRFGYIDSDVDIATDVANFREMVNG